jgi:hypothetical protein
VTDLTVVKVHVDELSSAQIWQHKLCATLSANVHIHYRLPIKVCYRNNLIVILCLISNFLEASACHMFTDWIGTRVNVNVVKKICMSFGLLILCLAVSLLSNAQTQYISMCAGMPVFLCFKFYHYACRFLKCFIRAYFVLLNMYRLLMIIAHYYICFIIILFFVCLFVCCCCFFVCLMVFNATFNNISVIS